MGRWLRILLLLIFAALPGTVAADAQPVRIGLTAVFLDDQPAFLKQWREYLEKRLERPVTFVQRGTYREIIDLLRQDKLDFAWVCGFPYVRNRGEMRLLAVPIYQGRPLYQSYLIVPAADNRTRSFLDLRGKVFAYSDPDSNSGYLYPNFALLRLREQPPAFFGRTFFTWSHRNVIEAVASGLAQGGAVDGYVWETLRIHHPELVAKTRLVQKSPDFGFPPFVARAGVPEAEFAAMQRTLLGMRDNPAGLTLLGRLNLNGFTAGDNSLFDGIAVMIRAVDGNAPAT